MNVSNDLISDVAVDLIFLKPAIGASIQADNELETLQLALKLCPLIWILYICYTRLQIWLLGAFWAVKFIHTYLVHPNKNVEDAAAIIGSLVPHGGEMFEFLASVYEKADDECDIGIAFNKRPRGEQVNECRDLLVAYATARDVEPGRLVAQGLAGLTTKKPGLGLLFLINGTEGNKHKVVISRFRASNGVLLTEGADMLTVEFINRVFMMNPRHTRPLSTSISPWREASGRAWPLTSRSTAKTWINQTIGSNTFCCQTLSPTGAGNKKVSGRSKEGDQQVGRSRD